MPTQRSLIKTGPAIVLHDGATHYFKTGLTIDEQIETFDVVVDAFGKVDERVKDRRAIIKGTPSGEWESLAQLFPHVAAPVGSRIFGDAADVPLVIHAIDGTRWTYHNVALTTMPALAFGATETLLGEADWTAITADGADPAAADSLVTRDTAAFADTSFLTAKILTQRYSLAWGAAPWDAFRTEAGVKVAWNLTTADITADGLGVVDKMITGLGVTATFKPLGIAKAAIDAKLALQGAAGAALGASLNARGEDLAISGTGVYVVIRGAAAKSAQSLFGLQAQRNGDLVAVATRTFTNGVADPLAYVGTAAPQP